MSKMSTLKTYSLMSGTHFDSGTQSCPICEKGHGWQYFEREVITTPEDNTDKTAVLIHLFSCMHCLSDYGIVDVPYDFADNKTVMVTIEKSWEVDSDE